MIRFGRSIAIVTAYDGSVVVVRERERAAVPDERVVDDLGDLHFQAIAELLLGEHVLLHRELAEAAAVAQHQLVDAPALLGGDLLLAQQDRSEAELLAVRAGVDERAVLEEEPRLAPVARDA